MIDRVGIIGLGEVGRILAEDLLVRTALDVRVWDYQFDNAASVAAKNLADLQDNARVNAAANAADAARGCQVVLSAVTADQACDAAESILPGLEQGAHFVDLNSVSPGTKLSVSELIASAGGHFVEASVMSPIMPRRSDSPILLSGPHAADFATLAPVLGFDNVEVASADPGVASATKMCRSVIIKGMEALVTESLLTARHHGVEDAVLASLANLFPGTDWNSQARYLISRTLEHGERRAAEMREVARTINEAGYTPWMSEGCVERQAWAPQFAAALEEDSLTAMLDAIRTQSITKQAGNSQ
tara:strand:+ start:6225 stop:7130 length:906 start_codon:yes stop_codon:yes gene_type:complete